MRKRIVGQESLEVPSQNQNWLDLETVAQVELSSEDRDHPIESALLPKREGSWRASDSGQQFIRLFFDEPLDIERIHLEFLENTHSRTQEFVIICTAGRSRNALEIVRQQYCFNPLTTTSEIEDYRVELRGITMLELKITPDISGGMACASLEQLRLGEGPRKNKLSNPAGL